MNTLYFKYALAVERAGSISQAAQNLYMAQPNLSKAIKDLESELGYEVFKRSPGGIKVTEKGSEFLYHAGKMMEQLAEMEKISVRDDKAERKFKLSIPRGSYIANGFTSFVAEIQMTDGIEITINETNALKTISNVTERGYNMGIIRYEKADEDFFHTCLKNNKLEQETIWEFEYVLVMSKNHPLAGKENLCEEDLRDYVKITHADIDGPRAKAAEQGQLQNETHGKTIYVYERGSQFDLLANVPSTYMWVSPIPNSYLEKNNLIQRACKAENNRYKDVLVYRQDYKFGDYDKLFQKKLYESKVEVSSTKYN
ncbi:MAG: LysR family transcriptional regulator [Lachnospiraceae bacterium]|nr:LysR family transcriptional regulator [Lachnospiraceae bacterium]